MFATLKQKLTPDNLYKEAAHLIYCTCLNQTRQARFYEHYGVEDTFEGRFDLLLVHVFCVLHVMKETDGAFNQALFDATFADMDQTLREMGIGDMGVPKHMRRMMKAFNGRMHSYDAAYNQDDAAMKTALSRNLYNDKESITSNKINKMYDYIHATIASITSQNLDDIRQGTIHFIEGDI